MIRKLENVDKIESREELIDFIKKVSPFSDQNPRLMYVINEFFAGNMQRPYVVSMNETSIDPITKINSIKHFMIWSIGTTMYVGTEFIPEPELTKGLNVSDYEENAT